MTVDANVFVSALNPSDIHFKDSLNFVDHVRYQGSLIICPSIVLPECAGAVIRPTGDLLLTQRTVKSVRTLPGIRFVSVTVPRAMSAVAIATTLRLRGADSVYVAVAQEFGTTLITWDTEMLTRGIHAVSVMTPTDWLTANSTV